VRVNGTLTGVNASLTTARGRGAVHMAKKKKSKKKGKK
jgi:hypothetical protein